MGARPSLPRWTEIGLSPTLDLPLINLEPCEQRQTVAEETETGETEDGLDVHLRWSEGGAWKREPRSRGMETEKLGPSQD